MKVKEIIRNNNFNEAIWFFDTNIMIYNYNRNGSNLMYRYTDNSLVKGPKTIFEWKNLSYVLYKISRKSL